MNKKKILLVLGAVLLCSLITICIYWFFLKDEKEVVIVDDTGSTEQGINEVVVANNDFAFDLFTVLNEQDEGNIFFSPYSISSALAMTYEGARGETADEMQSVFNFADSEILRSNYAAIFNKINGNNEEYELNTGNALWVQNDYQLLDDYTNTINQYYGGKVENLDFTGEPEQSRTTINDYIAAQTNDKIKDLLPSGIISSDTKLILTNAIYFKGTWLVEFDEEDTYEEVFYVTPNDMVEVDMMHMSPEEQKFNYAETEDLQILELPYKGEEISMLILLPTGDLSSIESDVTVEKLAEYKAQMEPTEMDAIALPKFEFDSKYFMKETLEQMGMSTAFSGNADFSDMTGSRDLYIGSVIHQAYVKVDEVGTEAAAATAVVMVDLAMMPENVFQANHPFIFIIQDVESGNILFLGRVADPTL